MDLYYDGWCRIMDCEDGSALYTDMSCMVEYFMPLSVGKMIAVKMSQDLKHGYRLLDFWLKICGKRCVRPERPQVILSRE